MKLFKCTEGKSECLTIKPVCTWQYELAAQEFESRTSWCAIHTRPFPPRTRRDLEADAALLRELQRNEKVAFDEEGRLYYQPEIHVKSKEALLKKIQVSDKPVLLKSILEAYPRAARDLEVGWCAYFEDVCARSRGSI